MNLRWEILTKRKEQRDRQGGPQHNSACVACNEGWCHAELEGTNRWNKLVPAGVGVGQGSLPPLGVASLTLATIAKLEDDQKFTAKPNTKRWKVSVSGNGPWECYEPLSGVNGSGSLAMWYLIRMIIKWVFQRNLRQGKSSSVDTRWATFHFETKEGQESHLCSLKLDSCLLLSLLPNRFSVFFQRDIGIRRPACVGICWTLERKTQSGLHEVAS